MKWIFSSVTVIVSLFLFSVPVLAQQETTISVSPAILDLGLQKGESRKFEITIRNGGDFALPVSAVVQSLLQDDEIIFTKQRKISDASEWIKFSDSEFLLAEKEVKKLSFSVDVPENTSSGGHYAQIAVRGLSLEQNFESGTSIVLPEVVVTILITIAGDTNTAISFMDKNIVPFFATPSTNYEASFKISNTGNIHDLITPVFVVVKDNKVVYRQRLSSKISLPNTEKEFNESLQLPDDYGFYKTFIEVTYANGQKTITSTPEIVIITPPLYLIFMTLIMTVSSLYIYNHRQHIGVAWKTLLGDES